MAGIYIHIPFCRQKCIYCDFFSIVSESFTQQYVVALVEELKLRKTELQNSDVKTIYLGGGTPSVLTHDQLDYLIKNLKENISLENVEEFTIEVNPDDITDEYASMLSKFPINRISMGVQSLIDSELKVINRRHLAQQVRDAYGTLRSYGFNNISLDLIFGLPGQSISSLKTSLNGILAMNPEHISVYGLMYEKGTLLYNKREKGEIIECSDELYDEMENLVEKELREHGYIHYEISNYAHSGKYSLHNSSYWNDTPYLGLGVSAHSYDGYARRYNPNNIIKYIESMNNKTPYFIEEVEDKYERYNSYIMTRLRTIWGIELSELKKKYGEELYDYFMRQITQFINSEEMIINNGVVQITEKGIIRSDTIFRELFYVQ